MTPLVIGAIVLFLFLVLLRGFATADPKFLLRVLRYVAAALCGALALLLALTGRLPIAFVLASVAWGLATGGHVWPLGWPHFPGGSWPSGRGTSQTTSVRTPWLEMELDHSTGAMHGTVLKGRRAGMPLSSLKRDEILDLYLEAGGDDAETARLLEAYMDREFGDFDWRERLEAKRSTRNTRTGMSRQEALKVLGLSEGAGEDDIRAAHRRLMMQNHPDRGGSDYIAAKINEAKDVLLGR